MRILQTKPKIYREKPYEDTAFMPVEKQGSEAMMNLDCTLLNGKAISVTEVKYDPSFKAF